MYSCINILHTYPSLVHYMYSSTEGIHLHLNPTSVMVGSEVFTSAVVLYLATQVFVYKRLMLCHYTISTAH